VTSELENRTKSLCREIYNQTPNVFLKANISIVLAALATETILNRVVRNYGLNHKAFLMLHMLLENGGSMTISELTKRLYISRQAVALATRKLEERGLVSREETREDGRKIKVTLTENGVELIREVGMSEWRKKIHNTLMSFVSEKEAKLLTTTLTSVAEELRRMQFNELTMEAASSQSNSNRET
jgi:DNA-binding MarR family transcriptional regulator